MRFFGTRLSLLVALLVGDSLVTSGRAATPGGIEVPLQVREDAGFARAGEPVRGGIPLPKAANLRDVRTLHVMDEHGRELPLQARALSRWDAPVSDESAPLRWVEIVVPATVAARGKTSLRVRAGDARAPEGAPLATRREGTITVDTGAFKAAFDVDDPGMLRLEAAAPGEKAVRAGRAREVTLVENGPLHAQILARGELAHGFREKGGQRALRWIARWDFWKGIAGADVTFTIENPDRPFVQPYNDRGDRLGKEFGSLALVWDGAGKGETRIGGLGSAFRGDARLIQKSAAELAISGRKTPANPKRAEGWMATGSSVLGARNFWQNAPAALEAKDGRLTLELFAGEGNPQFFQGSRAKTWEVFLRREKDVAAAAAKALQPPRLTIDPAWLQASEALGPISVADPARWPAFEATAAAITAEGEHSLAAEREFEDAYGWMDFGDTMRSGSKTERLFGNAELDFGGVLLRGYLRDPAHRAPDLAAAHDILRHVADIDVLHTDDDNSWANHGVHKHDSGGDREHEHAPDFSHFWVRGLLSYWLVTGDERTHDVAVGELGEWIREREDPKAPGTLVWVDELRDAGWSLIAMTDLYEATGETEWMERAKRVIHVTILPGVGADGSMRKAPFVDSKDWFAPWQQAYVADGLGRYCVIARRRGAPDREAEGALKKMLDYFASDDPWVKGPVKIWGREYPETIAFEITPARKDADEASMTQALADPFAWGAILFGEDRYAAQAARALAHVFPSGPEIHFEPSIRTPAKSSAIRLYFGEVERWREQTRSRVRAEGAGIAPSH